MGQAKNMIRLQEQVDMASRSDLKIEIRFPFQDSRYQNNYLAHLIQLRKQLASNMIHGNEPEGGYEMFDKYSAQIKEIIGL